MTPTTAAKKCLKILGEVRPPGEAVKETLREARHQLEHLATFGKCRYCGKKVPADCNTCAICSDENGP